MLLGISTRRSTTKWASHWCGKQELGALLIYEAGGRGKITGTTTILDPTDVSKFCQFSKGEATPKIVINKGMESPLKIG